MQAHAEPSISINVSTPQPLTRSSVQGADVAAAAAPHRHHARRRLHDTAADDSATVTRVNTPADLRDALRAGARHIVILQHLDLTFEPLLEAASPGAERSHLGPIREETRSITVRPSAWLACIRPCVPALQRP